MVLSISSFDLSKNSLINFVLCRIIRHTPMDYDNDDFQDHNHRLSGEKSSNLSPVLHPHALPKFDFDDNLQTQLRFDTLVENEVFLGISTQENNQWIEDFSRGSSEIEFNSSATESCSISRRNNVWFEATSSESVEMLLKAVGQEEGILGEAVIEESDAGNEFGRLTKEMEPNLKQDDKVEDIILPQPALALDIVTDGIEDSALADHPNVVCTSEAQRDDPPYCGISGEVESNLAGVVVVIEGNSEPDRKCDDADRMEVENSISKSLTDNIKEPSSVSAAHLEIVNIESASSVPHNVIVNSVEMNDQENICQVTDVSSESVDALLVDNSTGMVEHNTQSKESTMVDEMSSGSADKTCADGIEYPHCVDTRVESLIEQKDEVYTTTSQEPSESPIKVDNHFHLREEYKYDMDSREFSQHFKAVVSSEGRELGNQFHGSHEDSSAVCQGDRSDRIPNEKVIEAKDKEAVPCATPELEMGSVEDNKCLGNQMVSLESQNIDICNNKVGTSSCPEMEMDSEVRKDKFPENNHQMDTNVLAVASVFVDHGSGKQGVGSAEDPVGLSSLTSTCSSVELLREQSLNKDLISEGCKSPLAHGESVKPKEKDINSEEGGVYNADQVVSFDEKQSGELQTESINLECKVVGSLHSDKCSEGKAIKPHGSEFSGTKEQGLYHDTAEEVTFNKQTSSEIGLNSVDDDKTYAAETEGREDTDLSCPKESLELATGLRPVNEYGKASQSEQEASEAGKHCSEKLEVCSVSVDSTVKPVDVTAAADSENHNDMPIKRNAIAALIEVPEAISVSTAVPCLDQRRNDHEAIVASETQITEQIGPSAKDDRQASVALACPSLYGSDSMNEDGCGPVYSIEDNCVGQQMEIKETTKDSFQHIESVDSDGTNTFVSLHPENEATREPSTFTFDVCPSSGPYEGKNSGGCLSFPSIQVDKVQMDIEGSPLTPNTQIDLKMVPEVSRETPQAPVVIEGKAHVSVKVTPERKTRRASGKATVRSAKKGNTVKEVTSGSQSDKVDKSPVLMHTPRTGQPVQFKELKPCGGVARSGTKPLPFIPIPTSNLPDLNTSVPTAAYFQQPFTDLQQVQLRAQIFVYGSLIQEAAPDEACMISAFGQPEGGGNVWGPAWRACVERVLSQKSRASNMGTPIQSGGKAPGQLVKHSALQNEVLPSPSGRASSKGIPSPAVTPIIPLSSPLWNVSTPYDGLQSSGMARGGPVDCHQPLSPLNSYQIPGTRNFAGQTPSWPSQSPLSSTWMASPQTSASNANAHISLLPNTEPVKPTPAKDSPVPSFPGMNIALLPVVPQDSSSTAVSSGTSFQPDMSKVPAIPRSADSKPRKRKKVLASEGSGHIPFLALNQGASAWPPGVNSQFSPVPETVSQKLLLPQFRTESVQTAAVSSLFSTSVDVTAPDRFKSASSPGKFPTAVSPKFAGDQPNKVDQNLEKGIIPEEISSTVEEAKLHAETAAAHAANAVSHYHDIWSQLTKHKDSGVTSDVEAKLASLAVAITAATSVARAAAAAAMIASNVAVQAKLMADEASFSSAVVDPTNSNSLSKATSSAILKRGDGSVYPSSIITVAREAAKKRVEAASAASKHAENLDAIVKAAELAAEAVSQAGRILSVGGSLPLSELEELGPLGSLPFSIELFNFSAEEPKGGPSGVESKKTGKVPSLEKEQFRAQRGRRASELAKTTGVVPEAEAGPRSFSAVSDYASANAAGPSIENGMKEGCLVEVFKDGGSYKAAWYSAIILELKDGKAFLCYTDLQAEDGSGKLKEWVPLQSDFISMPTIRIAHPTTNMRFDGTSRKRKAAVMDYSWSVGDRVDVWVHDCWREGVVKEKSKNDETTLTIDFPALGNTSIARAWHLRPTLTWQDGKWTEWSSLRQHSPSQGNGPQEKRVRLGSPIEAKGKDKTSRGVDFVELRKHEESRLLPISENEREFNIGTVHENKQESRRTLRTGLQKEGSRVVFGVPKPGKKRKFMDVSKHFDSDQSRRNMKTDDSVKFARNMAPQLSGSRGWKNSAKIDLKEKQAAEDKPKVLRSRKPPIASGRTLPRKDNNLVSTKSSRAATVTDRISEDAVSSEENDTGQDNLMEFGSVSDSQDTSEGQTLVAHKKDFSSNARIGRHNKGKSVPSGGRIQEKLVPEVVEPRRSNRTIQPTSRLLEGLQSSLSITKIPFSSSKSHRSQSRSKF